MSKPFFLASIVFVGAAICLGTAIFDWNWAMKTAEAKPVVSVAGRKGARIFYALLGLGFAAVGVMILTGVLPLPEAKH